MRRFSRQSRRIIILCEGDTEESAIRHFISPQWEIDGLNHIGLHSINLAGKLDNVTKYTERYLKESNVIAVFTLIDLYGMGRVQHNSYDDLATKVDRVKDWLRQGLDSSESSLFYPHVSVHEVEAWLLADGLCLAQRLKAQNITPDPQAEIRNFENPPSRRLKELFRQHGRNDYYKLKDGVPLFKAANFETVYKLCSHFRDFYDELVAVVQSQVAN